MNRYNFAASGFAPDAIVINLGTNDYSHCRSLEGGECEAGFAEDFTRTYVEFMKNATKWYQKSDIQFFAGGWDQCSFSLSLFLSFAHIQTHARTHARTHAHTPSLPAIACN